MKKFLSFFCALCICASVIADCPNTSGASLWSSVYPGLKNGDNVNIAAGSTVLLDVSPNVQLNSVNISGTLYIKDTTLELKTGFLKVMRNGALIAGGSDCPITQKVTITLYGSSSNAMVNTIGTEFDNGVTTQFGSKGLVVTSGGTIALYGQVLGPVWTRISTTATSGSTQISVQDAVQWKAGDSILITSTDYSEVLDFRSYGDEYSASTGYPFEDQNEKKVVTAVSGDGKTITLDSPLRFTHWGKDRQFAEVGLLNRKIVITSDPGAEADKMFGGHIMMRKGKRIELSGIEVTRMGQRGVLARYPVHFHNMRFVDDIKPFIKDSSIHDNFQRCVVVHESHGVTIQNNVAFNTTGHCYFLEDGGEHGNTFDSNIGVLAKPISGAGQLIPSDDRPAIFWITNPNNTWTNNVAVGGQFGFWFGMPVKPRNLGKTYWDSDPYMFPRQIPLGKFDSNVAHSNVRNGMHIDEMEDSNGVTEMADYNPQQGPYTSDYPYGGPMVEARFTNFFAYKNRESGVWGHTGLHFDQCIFQDNARAFMVNGRTILSNSILTGETDNVGNPISIWGAAPLDRSYPDRWGSAQFLLQGHSSYDNGGPQFSIRNTFENFVSKPGRPAGALVPLQYGPFMLFPRNQFGHELTFNNANRVFIDYGSVDVDYGWLVLDADGTVTGVPGGAWIQSNETHFLRDGCQWNGDWNAYVCPLFAEGYVQFSFTVGSKPGAAGGAGTGYDIPKTGGRVIRGIVRPLGSDYFNPNSPKGGMQGAETMGNSFQYMHNLIARRAYSLEFYTDDGNPSFTPGNFQLGMYSSHPGDWIILAYPYPAGTTFQVSRTGYPGGANTQVNDISQLAPDTYYYDSNTKHLYILLLNPYAGDEFTNVFGYGVTDAGWYNPMQITASCGSNCQPALAGVPPAINYPAPLVAESYSATLQGCQSLVSPTSTNNGQAYFFFHPNSYSGNKELHYKVYHDLKGTGLSISILNGQIAQAGKSLVTQSVSVGTTASSGIWYLSRAQWELLAGGNLYVSVSDSNGNEMLRGQIQCSGTCSKPPKSALNLEDPCKPSYDTLSVYSDALADKVTTTAWNESAITTNLAYTNDVLCGTNSIRFGFPAVGNAFVISYWGSQNDLVLDPKYKSLEFFVKVAPGFGSIPLRVGMYSATGQEGWQILTADEIDNYVIDETVWSRVRISLTKLKVSTFTSLIKGLYITYDRWPYAAGDIIVDEIRFSSEDEAPITTPADVTIPQSAPICKNGQPVVGGKNPQMSSAISLVSISSLLVAILALLL